MSNAGARDQPHSICCYKLFGRGHAKCSAHFEDCITGTLGIPSGGRTLGFTLAAISSPETAMARLTILEYPDPRLRTRAAPVTHFDAALKRQIADMFE